LSQQDKFLELVENKGPLQAVREAPGVERLADGLANIVSGMVADIHAAYMGVFYGNGQVNPPPYLA
jgi:hypothetical protein